MIHLIRRLLDFSGKERNALIVSFIFSLLNAIFEMLPIIAILTVLSEMFSTVDGGLMSASTVWKSFVIMLASIAGRIVFSNLSCMKRTIGSFSMCANKRLEIGERLKRIPMGYFSDNRLGDIAAAVTTTLEDIENNAVTVLEKVAGGFIHAIVIGIWLLSYEWHIAFYRLIWAWRFFTDLCRIQKAGKRLSPKLAGSPG